MADQVKVEVYCPTQVPSPIPHTLYGPPSLPPLPPVIYHISCDSAPRDDLLANFVAEHTTLPRTLLDELLAFGAVYARVGERGKNESPRVPRAAPGAQVRQAAKVYVRVHATPKRHRPRGALRTLFDNGQLILVSKPSGIPVCATNDNAVECVTALMNAHITHRIDIATSGVVALARTASGVRDVNQALQTATKRYLVLTREKPTSPGTTLRHWLATRANRGRGQMKEHLCAPWRDGKMPDYGGPWGEAALIVRSVNQCKVALNSTEHHNAFESEVELITGRTHQIRTQFAAEGCALWGDTKYEQVAGRLLNRDIVRLELGADPQILGLCAVSLALEWQGRKVVVRADDPWWRST